MKIGPSFMLCLLISLPCHALSADGKMAEKNESPAAVNADSVPAAVAVSVASVPVSSGVAAVELVDLPDSPQVPRALDLSWTGSVRRPVRKADRLSVTTPAFSTPNSQLRSLPLANVAMRSAQRLNTDDGSMLDSFAICYRLNDRSSLQVVPGDPAPVKLAVATLANNAGVTVGLVFRLGAKR